MSRVPPEVTDGYEALRHGIGAYRRPRDVVAVTGPDAARYLQGQCSQDLAGLEVGGSAPSLLLEPDGKLAALVRVIRVADDGYVLDTDAGFADTVVMRLARFRLRTKVAIEPLDWSCVALRGAGVAAAMAGVTGPRGGPLPDGSWIVAEDWNGTHGVDLLGPDPVKGVPDGASWCDQAAWEALRVESGIPAMGAELDSRTIAAEAGLVTRTVSFTKGCYTGQELVARLDARGSRVARRLCAIVPVDPASAAPDGPGDLRGAELWPVADDGVVRASDMSGRPLGTVTSAAWCPAVGDVAGIGYVHRTVDVGATVRWRRPGGGDGDAGRTGPVGTAVVAALPLVSP